LVRSDNLRSESDNAAHSEFQTRANFRTLRSGLPDVFKPKIQLWVNFGESRTGRCWYILWTLGPFYGLLLHFMDTWYVQFVVIWYIFPRFGILYEEKSGNPA
jgi:hypothetical protein